MGKTCWNSYILKEIISEKKEWKLDVEISNFFYDQIPRIFEQP